MAKANPSPLWKRPFLLFILVALGIILPSGVLSYLGFQSFQYETQLLDQKNAERFEKVGLTLEENLNKKIEGWLDSLKKFGQRPDFRNNNLLSIVGIFQKTKNIDELNVDGLFLFDTNGKLTFPPVLENKKRKIKDPVLFDVSWGIYKSELDRLDRIEFQQKDYIKLKNGLIQLLKRDLSPIQNALLLKRLGGTYKKLDQSKKAIETYQKLIRNYGALIDPTGYPLEIIGKQLIASLHLSNGDKKAALMASFDIEEKMSLGYWNLNQDQKRYLLDVIKTEYKNKNRSLIQKDPALKRRNQKIIGINKFINEEKRAAQSLLDSDWGLIYLNLQQKGWMNSGGAFQLSDEKSILLVSPFHSRNRIKGLLAAIVPSNQFESILESHIKDQAKLAGATISLHKNIESINLRTRKLDPPLGLKIYPIEPDIQTTFHERRKRIYAGMIGLSLLVIVAGIALMMRSINKEIENVNIKSEFVANVSHEIRTPLSSISYVSEKLKEGRFRSSKEAHDFYQILDEEVYRLKDLVNNILDFSKLSSGKRTYQKEKTQISTLIDEIEKRIEGTPDYKGFQFEIEPVVPPFSINVDKRLTIQALMNLVDNAVKYSGDSKIIKIGVEDRNKDVGIFVQDFGIGIKKEERKINFEKFHRSEKAMSQARIKGVGLGLSLVKEIVEGQKGHISVRSQLDKGTTITILFAKVKNKSKGKNA